MTTRLNTIPSTRTMTIKFLFAGSCSTLLSRFIMFAYPSPPVSRGCIIDLVNPTFLCLRHWQPRFHRRALTIINVDFYLSILFHHPSFYPCFHLIAYRNLARPIRFPPSPAQCVRSSTSRRGSAGTRLEQSSGQCTELCDFGLADQIAFPSFSPRHSITPLSCCLVFTLRPPLSLFTRGLPSHSPYHRAATTGKSYQRNTASKPTAPTRARPTCSSSGSTFTTTRLPRENMSPAPYSSILNPGRWTRSGAGRWEVCSGLITCEFGANWRRCPTRR